MARRRKCRELLAELADLIEQFTRSVAFHPIFELLDMFGILEVCDRYLVRAPGPLHRLAVHELWSGPAFWRVEHDHGPARTLHAFRVTARPRLALNLANLLQNHIERTCETLVHQRWIIAFYEMRFVAVTADQVGQFLSADAGEHGRIGDLEPVEMKDRKNRTVTRRIEKLVGVPARGKCARFRFAVADNAGDDQIRIVESGAICMNERITELAPFVDRTRSFRR